MPRVKQFKICLQCGLNYLIQWEECPRCKSKAFTIHNAKPSEPTECELCKKQHYNRGRFLCEECEELHRESLDVIYNVYEEKDGMWGSVLKLRREKAELRVLLRTSEIKRDDLLKEIEKLKQQAA